MEIFQQGFSLELWFQAQGLGVPMAGTSVGQCILPQGFHMVPRCRQMPSAIYQGRPHPGRCNKLKNYQGKNMIHLQLLTQTRRTLPGSWFRSLLLVQGLCSLSVIACIGLEEPLKGHFIQPPCREHRHLQLDQVVQGRSSLTLSISMDGTSTPIPCPRVLLGILL